MSEKEKVLRGLADINNNALIELQNQIKRVQSYAKDGKVSTSDLVDVSNGLTSSYQNYITANNNLLRVLFF